MTELLKYINLLLCDNGINYELGQMTEHKPNYPYWVGEYTESGEADESGQSDVTFILNGFARNSFAKLEADKEKIKKTIGHGLLHVTEHTTLVTVCYGGSIALPPEPNGLRRMQITLNVKLWRKN